MRWTESLARRSARHPWKTLVAWTLVIVAGVIASSMYLSDALTTDIRFTNDPEAKRAAEVVEERFGEQGITEVFLIRSRGATVESPAFEAHVRELQEAAMEAGGEDVMSAVTYYDTRDPSMVSDDRRTTLMPVTFAATDDTSAHLPLIDEVVDLGNADGFLVRSVGATTIGADFTELAEEGLAKGETFGVLAALIVLVIVFGAVVAGVVPILIGLAAIVAATGMVAVVGQTYDFSIFVTNMVSMMGLAVGIDYSLFILSRYREERRGGNAKVDAIGVAAATASRAVFFSGMTVVIALAGMLIVPHSIFRSLAAGAIFVVLVAVVAALTLLPALLSVLGDKINALGIVRSRRAWQRTRPGGFWDRISHGVMRRPLMSVVMGTALLLAMAFSYFDIDTGFAGVTTLPDDTPSKQAFVMLEKEFSGDSSSPVEIVVDGDADSPEVRRDIAQLRDALAEDDVFGSPQVRVNEDGGAALISIPLNADPVSRRATDAVGDLRDRYVPAAFERASTTVLVGGQPADNKDFYDLTADYTPRVFVIVLALSFVLLTIVFRSIVVPIKAIIMNLLSVGAAYGLLVLVFQKGIGAELFGFRTVESIETWLPLFLFSMLFGLSMDYHVFLLSRIRERFDRTRDNSDSIAFGLRTTGGLITGAAIIMVAVFSGFAAGELTSLQQFGFGLAVAVLLDATLVRCVLVPASMTLLGDRNWYLPRWLTWLPDVKVEAARPAPTDRALETA